MYNPRFKFQQKVFIFGVVFGQLRIVSRKALYHVQIFPKSHGDKMGNFAFFALQNIDADIAFNRLIIGNGSLFWGNQTLGRRRDYLG